MRARARNSAPAIRTASSESEMPKPAVSLGLSELTSPRIHRLHGWLAHQRGKRGGLLPRRGDIAPDEIKDLERAWSNTTAWSSPAAASLSDCPWAREASW
jgi:hypothetical protein